MKNKVKHNLIFALFLTIFAVIFAAFALGSTYSAGSAWATTDQMSQSGELESYVIVKTDEEVSSMAINVGGVIDGKTVVSVAYSPNGDFTGAEIYSLESKNYNKYYNAEVFSGLSLPAGYFKIFTTDQMMISEVGLFNEEGIVTPTVCGICDYSTDFRYETTSYSIDRSGVNAIFDSQEGMKIASGRYDTLSEIEIELMSSVNSYLYLDKTYATYEAMPFATLIFSGAVSIFGNSIFGLRIVNYVSYMIFVIAFCLIMSKVFKRGVIGILGGIVALLVGFGFDIATIAGPFKFTYIFLLIAIYFAIKYITKRETNFISTNLIVSGVMLTFSVACSLNSLIILLVLATILTLYILVRRYSDEMFGENRRYIWHFTNLGVSFGLIPVTFMLGIIVFVYNTLIDYAIAMKLFTIVSREMEKLISIKAVDCIRNAGRLCKVVFTGTVDKCKYLVRVTTSEMLAIFGSLIVFCTRFVFVALASFRKSSRIAKEKDGEIKGFEAYMQEPYRYSGRQKMRLVT